MCTGMATSISRNYEERGCQRVDPRGDAPIHKQYVQVIPPPVNCWQRSAAWARLQMAHLCKVVARVIGEKSRTEVSKRQTISP